MTDLYLDPIFTVEGDDFVFEAHDDNDIDYLVRVTLDDYCSFEGFNSELFEIEEVLTYFKHESLREACQQIVDRYQTETTSYDVEIKRKKVETIEIIEYKCKGRKYKVLKQLSPYFGKTMKETSILSIQGITKGVCFEVLQGGEWDEVSFLFSELEEQK